MPTIVERYERAHRYVERAIAAVEREALTSSVVPVLNGFEWYASRLRTETARNDLSRIDARWLRATTEKDRSAVAREAELLADRVAETLPGAPQDWKRTNLTKDENTTGTAKPSLGDELSTEARQTWSSVETELVRPASSVLGWLAAGALAVGGWKLWQFLRTDEREERRKLSRALERAARDR